MLTLNPAICWKALRAFITQPHCDIIEASKNVKDVTMGNQQATATELGWLAGIIDGEGYLGLSVSKNLTIENKASFITPMMHICNTEEKIVLKTSEILQKLGIKTYCRVQNYTYNDKGKVVYKVQTKRQKSLIVLLENIGEYLTGNKYRRGKLILEFCQSRQNQRKINPSAPYNDRELEIVEQCLPLQRAGASETIRRIQLQKSEILKEQKKRQHKFAFSEKCECSNCGKIIIDRPARFKDHEYHFCNTDCYHEFQRNHPEFYHRPRAKQMIHCNYCGNEIWRTPKDINKTNYHFCSTHCRFEYMRKNKTTLASPQLATAKI